jgi:hypothetical protein
MAKFYQNDCVVREHIRRVLGSSFPELTKLDTYPLLVINRIYSVDNDVRELEWVWITDNLMVTYKGDGKITVEPRSSFTKIELATPGIRGIISDEIVDVTSYSHIIFSNKPKDGVCNISGTVCLP